MIPIASMCGTRLRGLLNAGRLIFWGVLCVTCQRHEPNSTSQDKSPPSAVPSVEAQPPAQVAEQRPVSGCFGQYQGTYTVAATKPGISRKQGAPAQWDAEDGHTLLGQGELALKVDAQNLVSGSAKGALGQQTLRGSCDENTLRIQLDATGSEPTMIQNAIIVAELTGDQATGTLVAATGDSLVRRSGAVNLRKLQ